MRIVFFNIPAHGHTNPTLPVAAELVRRGHEVRYYSYEPFREKIQAAGAQFVPCDGYDAQLRLTPREAVRLGSDLALSTKVLVDTTLSMDEMVCQEMERLRPDCIVADSMAVWGKVVAKKLGIPFVCSTTTFAFNRYAARIMKQSVGELLGILWKLPGIHRQIRRLQKQGYPVNSVLDLIGSDDSVDTIVYTSRAFQPCSETFSERFAFTGPSIGKPGTVVEKHRPGLVYLSMGTVNNAMLPLYRAWVDALRDGPWQVILSVGQQIDLADLGPLPEHIRAYPQVDQLAVLEKADVFLTHCGMNSVSEALWYGVPLVMLPQTKEQSAVAARTAELGAGYLLTEQTPEAIRAALEQVLTDPGYREAARMIAQSFHACSGPEGAADKIEQCCNG